MSQIKAPAIGLFAGIAAGLMALAALRPGAFVLPMLFAAPAAVYIASLGWGTIAGAIAAVIGAGIAVAVEGPQPAIVIAALFFLPAAWAGHLANLARPSETGPGLDWFPVSGILLRLMAALFGGFVVAGIALGYDPAVVTKMLTEFFTEVVRSGEGAVDDATLEANARAYVALMPAVIPAMWLLLHVLVMHLSAIVTARSGVLARPAEDIAATANLPLAVVGAAAGALVGMTVLPSPGYEVAAIGAGLAIAGLGLVGLAQLHYASRGKPGRGIMLFLSYFVLVVFGLPILVLAVIGALRAFRGIQTPPPLPPGGSPPSR